MLALRHEGTRNREVWSGGGRLGPIRVDRRASKWSGGWVSSLSEDGRGWLSSMGAAYTMLCVEC